MSYDIPSVSELEAVQLLNKHYAEVITSKEDGIASGLDITQTTNPITGVTRRTLYKILDDAQAEHDAQISAHELEHDNQMQSFENDFDSRLAGMAFTPVGTFTSGATLTDARQTLLWEVSEGGDGRYYSWSGSFGTSGKVVAAGSSPSPIAAGSWVDRTDDSLRDEIRETVFQNMKHQAAEAGFNLVDGSFEEGANISGYPDVVWSQTDGKYYQWHLDEAKTVPAGSTPATSGGVGAGAWVDRTQDTLRGELLSGDFTSLFGYATAAENSVLISLLDKLSQLAWSVEEFGALGAPNDDSVAFARAFAHAQLMGGGVITGSKKAYCFSLNLAGNTAPITLSFPNKELYVPVGGLEILACNNELNGFASSKVTLFGGNYIARHYGSASTGDADFAVYLQGTSGIDAVGCTFSYGKNASFFGSFAQYCRFMWCEFSAAVFNNDSCGSKFLSPDGDNRSNEIDMYRCRWFSNKNHAVFDGCEKIRVYSPTFQAARNGGFAALQIIGTKVGCRAVNITGPYFEFNDSKDIYIGSAENVVIEHGIYHGGIGHVTTPNKTHSILANTAFNLMLLNNNYVTAPAPVINIPHDNGMLTVIGDNKEPTVNITGANNDYDIRTKSGIRCSLRNERVGMNKFRLGTLTTAGARGARLQFTENGADRGYIESNMANGHMVFDAGFVTANSYDFYANGALQHRFWDGHAKLTVQTFASNAAALAGGLGVGELYKTSTGEARFVV